MRFLLSPVFIYPNLPGPLYSCPKFASNITSNLPKYSKHVSISVETVNAQIIFGPIWTFRGKFFLKFGPFKGSRDVHVCLHWLSSSSPLSVNAEWDSSTESTRSETPRQQSQREVEITFHKLFYNQPLFTKISSFPVETSLTPMDSVEYGVSLCADWFDRKWGFISTVSLPNGNKKVEYFSAFKNK